MLTTRATVQFTIELGIADDQTGPASSLGEISKRAGQLARTQVAERLGDLGNFIQTPAVLSVTIAAPSDDQDIPVTKKPL